MPGHARVPGGRADLRAGLVTGPAVIFPCRSAKYSATDARDAAALACSRPVSPDRVLVRICDNGHITSGSGAAKSRPAAGRRTDAPAHFDPCCTHRWYSDSDRGGQDPQRAGRKQFAGDRSELAGRDRKQLRMLIWLASSSAWSGSAWRRSKSVAVVAIVKLVAAAIWFAVSCISFIALCSVARFRTPRSFDLADVAHGAARRVGGKRRIGAQGRRDRTLAAQRFPGRAAPRLHRPAAAGERGIVEVETDAAVGNVDPDRSPSSTRAIVPPSAASGETWPIERPEVPPLKRPSVTSAQALPRPFPFR